MQRLIKVVEKEIEQLQARYMEAFEKTLSLWIFYKKGYKKAPMIKGGRTKEN